MHQRLYLLFIGLTLFGQNRLNVILPDNFAHGAFGHGLHRAGRVLNIKQKVGRIFNDPENREIDIDDIFVTRQHQAFFRHIARHTGGAAVRAGAHADIDEIFGRHFRGHRRLNRPRQMIVQTRAGLRMKLAEAQHNALLIGLHAVKAAQGP